MILIVFPDGTFCNVWECSINTIPDRIKNEDIKEYLQTPEAQDSKCSMIPKDSWAEVEEIGDIFFPDEHYQD